MNEIQKKELMVSVTQGTLKNVQDKFYPPEVIIQDKTFFDYEILKAALKRQHRSIINFLFKVGCRVICPYKMNYEDTPLHIAMRLNHSNILITLIKKGASIYYKNANGETPIHTGFKEGFYSAVNTVLNYLYLNNLSYKDLNPTNKDDICHFHIACILNNLNVVRMYLKCRFNMNSAFSLDSTELCGSNPLHYTAAKNHNEMLECLILHGADLSVKNVDGQTILHNFYYSNQFRYKIQTVFNFTNDTKFINSIDYNGVSHFHLSCTLNNPDLAKVFIDNGVDVNSAVSVNCPLHPGFTPLHFAVLHRCDKVVQLLLKSGANCNVIDSEGVTPLHLACASFYLHLDSVRSIIDMLLDYNACVTIADGKGCTPLHKIFWNSSYRGTKILDMLISRIPREVNFTDNEGLSHFHIICTRNDTSRVEDFLKSGVDVDLCVTVSNHNCNVYSGYTPLHFAVLYNQKNIVKVLLKWKAQVNIQSKMLKITPLHLACECNYIKVRDIYCHQSKHVISNKKPIDSDWTLNRENQLHIIKLLLWHGADVEVEGIHKATPLVWACTLNYQDFFILFTDTWDIIDNVLKKEICFRTKKIIEILISNKANVNVRTEDQKSILHFVNTNIFLQDSEELIEFLVTNGADVNARDRDSSTLLHEACKLKNKKLLKILLKHKANVNVFNFELLTPLEVMVGKFLNSPDEKEMLCYLLEYGSDVNISIESCQKISKIDGKTLLHDAISNWNVFLVEKLLYYGADINIEDFEGNTCASYLFKWSEERMQRMWENNIGYAKMFETVFIHMQKLLALGLHVHEEVQNICIKLHKCHNIARIQHKDSINLDNIYNNCIEELNRMKLIKIDDCASLYSILTMDVHELSKKVSNYNLIKQLKDRICDNYPLYGYLLKLQFRKGLLRSEALQNANWSLCSITGLFLPNLCCDSILKDLTDKDITNLKTAAESTTTSYKRKWCRNNSNNIEFPAKLRRIV